MLPRTPQNVIRIVLRRSTGRRLPIGRTARSGDLVRQVAKAAKLAWRLSLSYEASLACRACHFASVAGGAVGTWACEGRGAAAATGPAIAAAGQLSRAGRVASAAAVTSARCGRRRAVVIASGGRRGRRRGAAGRSGRARGGARAARRAAREDRARAVLASTRARTRASRARLLARRGVTRVVLVTCAWHLPRAAALFRARGLECRRGASRGQRRARATRMCGTRAFAWRAMRVAGTAAPGAAGAMSACVRRIGCVALARSRCVTAVRRAGSRRAADASGARRGSARSRRATRSVAALARAEDRGARRTSLDASCATSHDVERASSRRARARADRGRRRASRALLRALADEDAETAAWGAYGLGFTCRGREERHVRALAARAASLGRARRSTRRGDDGRRDRSSTRACAIARALGAAAARSRRRRSRLGARRHDASDAERLRTRSATSRRGAARSRDDTVHARSSTRRGRPGTAPRPDAALYPFARTRARRRRVRRAAPRRRATRRSRGPAIGARLRGARARPHGRTDALAELVRVVADKASISAAERASAAARARRARAMTTTGAPRPPTRSRSSCAGTKDPFAIAALAGDELRRARVALGALGQTTPPKKSRAALYAPRVAARRR